MGLLSIQKSSQGALASTPHQFPQQLCVSWGSIRIEWSSQNSSLQSAQVWRPWTAPGLWGTSGKRFKEGLHSSTCYITYLWQGLRWTSAFTSKLRTALVVTGHTRSVSHTLTSLLGSGLIIISLPHFSCLFSITAHWLMSDHKWRHFSWFYVCFISNSS